MHLTGQGYDVPASVADSGLLMLHIGECCLVLTAVSAEHTTTGPTVVTTPHHCELGTTFLAARCILVGYPERSNTPHNIDSATTHNWIWRDVGNNLVHTSLCTI